MEQIAATTLPPRHRLRMDRDVLPGEDRRQSDVLVFAWRCCWSIWCSPANMRAGIAPVSVILAVPLSLVGPVSVLTALQIDNNLYVQIGLVLLIALSAKNAILIVEVARELRAEGKPIVKSAVEAARARFRPILMTSFAFILGVLPLVLATGAGASARKSIGITVFTGMLASTCLAVLFVPAFFVIVQRFEEWLGGRKQPAELSPSPGQ